MALKKVAVIVVFCFMVIPLAYAAGDEPLSWAMAVREARDNNPELMSARQKLKAAQANTGIVRSAALPQLSANAGADTSKTMARQQADAYSYRISGRQLLFDGFKASHDLAAAQEQVKSATYNYQVVSSNVRLELDTAFIGLLSAQENLNVTQNILSRRRQNMAMVTLQYQGGREHKGSLLTAEANAAQAELDCVTAERSIELYQRRLLKALGRVKFAALTATGDLTVVEIDRARPEFETLVAMTPLLKNLVAQKEAARFGVKSARSDFFPQVYADAGAGKSDAGWPPQTSNWSAGISVSFPIFQGGQQQAALAKAKAAYQQAEADARSGRDGVIFTLAQAWTQWINDVDQAAVQEKFFQAARQRAEIVEAQYKSGLATFNDWTIIEDDLVKNQKSLLQAKTNALLAEASWLQAKGETIDE